MSIDSTTPCEVSEPPSAVQLSQLLGAGRHGMVFLGVRTRAGVRQPVAVKVPSEPGGLDNEYLALKRFSHPNIVEIFDDRLANGALVLEYCDRGTLADMLCEETLTLQSLSLLLADVLDAVTELHAHGWIHGDISPSNIGLRSSAGPVLLDLATARPADGSAVSEGTEEFAGPIRTAETRLDIRSLSATALRALGRPDRWDHKKRWAHEQLTDLVDRCDTGQPVELDDLAQIVTSMPQMVPANVIRRDALGRGPNDNPTRAFGPRPTSVESNDVAPSSPRPVRRALVAGLVLLGMLLPLTELVRSHEPSPAETSAGAATLTRDFRPAATLEAASATWDTATGVLRIEGEGDPAHFATGRAGDIAAIADWSCDGVATLGVYRPSTGNWFEFDTWDASSTAAPSMLDGGTDLWISSDDAGCATAVLR